MRSGNCWPNWPRFRRKWTKGYRFRVLLRHRCSSDEAGTKSSTDNWNCSSYCCCWLGRYQSANWGRSPDKWGLQIILSRFDGSTDDLFNRSNTNLGNLLVELKLRPIFISETIRPQRRKTPLHKIRPSKTRNSLNIKPIRLIRSLYL